MKKFSMKKLTASFKTRGFKAGSYSVAVTAVVIAIAVAVNLLAAALPSGWVQFDTSANRLFTLSEQTRTLVGGLRDEVTVYWIVRSGNEDSYIETLLDKYADLSDKLTVVQKDPDLYPTFAQSYTESVTENSLIVESDARYRYVDYTEIFMLDYESYYYSGVQQVNFYGEQALTSAVDFVVSEDLPKIYALTGHGETALNATLSAAIDDENIETAELSLLTVEAVPEDADMLLVCAPKSDISADEQEKLQDYLAGGGKLLLLTDLQEQGRLENLESLMAGYGVSTVDGVVVEGDQNYYAWGAPHYLLPNIKSTAITDPLITNNYRVIMHIAQGLTVSDTLPEGVSVKEMLTTSDTAFSKLAGYQLQTYEKEDGDIDGPFALAVAITDSNTDSSLIWVSSSTLLDEQNNAMVSGGNQDLFLNMVNFLCEPEGSGITIRAKSLSTETLTVDSSDANLLAVFLIGVLPLGFIGCGIAVWYGRKRR